jgi:hypothetical protein
MRMSKSTGETNYMCPSGIMSLQYIWADNDNRNSSTETTFYRSAQSSRDTIQFASPEYAYQADDIKNVISTYKSQISIEHVAAFTTKGENQVYTIGIVETAASVRAKSGTNNLGFRFRTASYDGRHTFRVDRFATLSENTNLWDVLGSINRRANESSLKVEVINQADSENQYKFGYTSFNRVLPDNILTDSNAVITYPSEISAFGYPTVPAWNKFADGDKIRFMDDVTPVGTYSFINWSYPLCLDASGSSTSDFAKVMKDTGQMDNNKGRAGYFYPIGTGGKCMVIKFASNFLCGGQDTPYRMPAVSGQFAPIHVANIVKLCTPYGGYNK